MNKSDELSFIGFYYFIKMIYTKDNPKSVFFLHCFEDKKNFTGVVKTYNNTIGFYKNGKLQKEDGPAVEWSDGENHWYLNGIRHREDGPAIENNNGDIRFCLRGVFYGSSFHFTTKSWIKFVKTLIFS